MAEEKDGIDLPNMNGSINSSVIDEENRPTEHWASSRSRSATTSPTDLIGLEQLAESDVEKKNEEVAKIEKSIVEKVEKDVSPEAKIGRRRMAMRAAYGEFMCTILFYTPIFGCIANTSLGAWESQSASLAVAFVGGFQAIAISFAFSSVSGAHFNSAISFALWLTGKLSNRKAVMYIGVQLLASVVAMGIVTCIFQGDLQTAYNSCAVTPVDSRKLGRVFATEFFLTFFLTYVAFTVAFEDAENQKKDSMSFKTISDSKGLTLYASTPQSKTGFAPFAIGLTIFSLSLIGGTSGGAFNPGRMFGPAIFSGQGWDTLPLYWLGQFSGSSAAGLLVNNLHRFGLQTSGGTDTITAREVLSRAVSLRMGKSSTVTKKGSQENASHVKNPIVPPGTVEI